MDTPQTPTQTPTQAPPPTGDPVLAQPDRERLAGIVQKMIDNKEPDETIKAAVGYFKQKYAQPSGPLPGEGSYIYKPDAQPSPQDQHQQAVAQADQTLGNIRTQKENQAVNNMTQDYLKNQIQTEIGQYAKPSSTSVKQQPSAAALQFPNNQSDTDPKTTRFPEIVNNVLDPHTGYAVQLKGGLANDPTGQNTRQLYSQIQKDNPDLAPKIQSSIYAIDSKDRGENAPQILQNIQGIESGKLKYDIQKGQLQKPENAFQSLATGFEQRNQVINDYNDYTTLDRKGILNKLETKYSTNDPDKPQPVPSSGWAAGANMLGDQGPVTAEGAIAGLAGGILGKNPATAGWLAAAVTSPEFYARGFTGSLEKNYFDARRNGMQPDQALDASWDKAQRDASLDVAQGTLMTAAGIRSGLTATPGSVSSDLSPSYVNAATKLLKKIPTFAKDVATESGQMGAIGAAIQGLKNVNDGKPITQDVDNAFASTAGFTAVMAGLAKGAGALIDKNSYNSLKRGVADAPQPVIDETLGHLVNTGQITPEEANHATNVIQDQRAANIVLPKMDEQTQQKVQDLITQRDKQQQLMDDPSNAKYKTEFKTSIDDINEKIASLKGAPPKDELIQQAQDEIGKGEIKGLSKPIYEEIAANHPEQMPQLLKEIAEQSYDPDSKDGAIKTYGKGLVDIAQQMHPIETMPEYTSKINHVEPAEDAESVGQKPVSDLIEPDKSVGTLDYGDNAKYGLPETPIAKAQVAADIEKGNVRLGETGESFSEPSPGENNKPFLARILPRFKEIFEKEAPGTAVVSNSSVLKGVKVWDNMGRPDFDEMTPEQKTEFAKQYNNQVVDPGAMESFSKDGPNDNLRISDLMDKPISYKGERATLTQDGQIVIAKLDNYNREYEIGNIDQIKNRSIYEFGIEHETSVVGVNDEGNVTVRGNEYINNYSDPLRAINRDENGNVQSVNLETKDGNKRTFRGSIAEDIAYQLHLKEINKNNETRNAFEDFINSDGESKKQIENEGFSNAAKKATVTNNDEIQRSKITKPESGNNIHVIRHGETEDNLAGKFRQADTNLTQEGINQAENTGAELKDKLGGQPMPKIITSDLPRTIHTANLIHDVVTGAKPDPRAVEISGEEQPHLAADVLQGSYDRLVDSGTDPNSREMKAMKDHIQALKAEPSEQAEPRLVGISHEAQADRTKNELNINAPERGEGITLEDAIQKGRDLIKEGTSPKQVFEDFEKDGKISADAMSVVRAEYERLARETNTAYDKYGSDSPEGKAALDAERTWYNTAVKPMQTEWHKVGMTQQGKVDIDTGSITGMRRAFNEVSGKDFTPEQEKTAKELSDKVKGLSAKVDELQNKIDDLMKKGGSESVSKGGIRQKGKALADTIRGAKLHRPDMFSSATPASLAWDAAVEVVAKSVEAGSEIAQAISDGINSIKATDWYKNLSDKDQKKAENQFAQWHNEQADKKVALEDHFANKTDNKFTTDEAKAIWDYAKENYIDKGTTDFHDIVNGTAKDIGLSPDQVRHAIATPKGAKVISDQMYKAMYDRRTAIQNAEIWVKSADQPKLIKFFKALPGFFFAAKTFGHGTVGGITHAGMNLFKPTGWNKYFPFFFQQFKNAFGNTADYERAMADHVRDPDYIFWKRAGLSIDPNKAYDEYGNLGKYFGKIGLAGERGFNALKMYRLSQAKDIYSHLSNIEKADPQTAKEIAKIVNHSTGTTEVKVPSGFNVAFFAPKLEISRWQRFIQQPIKAVQTFSNWNNASAAEKVAAKLIARRSGEMIATYASALAANQAILSLTGSNQKINFTNPTQSDWLKFKAGGKSIDVSGGMLATAIFIGTLIGIGRQAWEGDKNERTKPQDKLYGKIGQQMRYKLSPFGSTAADLITGVDAMGRPLPYSSVKPPKGEDKYTLWSYLGEAQTPIPIAEGIQAAAEGMKEKGMSSPDIMDVLNGIVTGVVSGGTGTHLNPDYSLMKKSTPNASAGLPVK